MLTVILLNEQDKEGFAIELLKKGNTVKEIAKMVAPVSFTSIRK